jgi:hypothetical protein
VFSKVFEKVNGKMADADSDLENNFPINIYSPIDPRFNNYNANYRQNVNESRDQTVTSENSIISGSYPYDTRFSSTDVDFSKSPYDRYIVVYTLMYYMFEATVNWQLIV